MSAWHINIVFVMIAYNYKIVSNVTSFGIKMPSKPYYLLFERDLESGIDFFLD
jgi:hypothetical protein